MEREQLIEDVASLIGEGVHTGLRKFSEHPASGDAWRAIRELPAEDWDSIVKIAAITVIEYVEAHNKP
jgi:hypothetical protein